MMIFAVVTVVAIRPGNGNGSTVAAGTRGGSADAVTSAPT
ncbi:hypothetical protein STENM223S_03933 [Streptomyces tendae]